MKVEQFLNRNQFHIYGEGKDILQSYNSKVVEIKNKNDFQWVKLGHDWDYSTTTSKHVYAFLDVYSKIRIYGVTNKRKYIKDLIQEYKENREEFLNKHNYALVYDEEMI